MPTWPGSGLLNAAKDLVHCIATGETPRCSGADGRAAIEVIMALYESQRRDCGRVDLSLAEARRMVDLLREEGVY